MFINHLSSALTQHSINKGHNGCFQVDLISVSPRTSVQIVYKCLRDDRSLQALNIFTQWCFKMTLSVRRYLKPLCTWLAPTHLESCPLAGEALVVQHGLQDFFVPARHQAHGAHDLQHRHLGLDVLRGQALSDDVDALWVREDVGAALRVVHQSFDAADQRRVDLRLCGLIVHALQEV